MHCGLGNVDEAVRWLEQAYEDRDALLFTVNCLFEWPGVRQTAGYRALLETIGLDPDWQPSGLER